MSIALVQQATGHGTTTTLTVTIPATTTGNCLVLRIALRGSSSSITSVADSAGNTWDSLKSVAATYGTTGHGAIYWRPNAGSITSVTITVAGSTLKVAANLAEYSGVATSSELDTSATSTNASGTSGVTGTTTGAAGAGELVAAALAVGYGTGDATFNASGSTPTTGWSALTEDGTGTTSSNGSVESEDVVGSSAAQTYQGAWTLSNSAASAGVVVLLKAAAGGTQYTQSVDATAASTTSTQNLIGAIRSAAAGSTAALIKQAGHVASAAASELAGATKRAGKAATATAGSAIALARAAGKLAGAASGSSATQSSQTSKGASALAGDSAALGKAVGHAVAATAGDLTGLARRAGHSLAASVGSAASLTTSKLKLLSVVAAAASLPTRVGQVGLARSATSAAALSLSRQVGVVRLAAATATATLPRQVQAIRTASSVAAATVARLVGKAIAGYAQSTPPWNATVAEASWNLHGSTVSGYVQNNGVQRPGLPGSDGTYVYGGCYETPWLMRYDPSTGDVGWKSGQTASTGWTVQNLNTLLSSPNVPGAGSVAASTAIVGVGGIDYDPTSKILYLAGWVEVSTHASTSTCYVLAYDTTQSFTSPSSWAVLDLRTLSASAPQSQCGVQVDRKRGIVYYVPTTTTSAVATGVLFAFTLPSGHSGATALADFVNSANWTWQDLTSFNAGAKGYQFAQVCSDYDKLVFVPYATNWMAVYDLTKLAAGIQTSGNFTFVNVATLLGNSNLSGMTGCGYLKPYFLMCQFQQGTGASAVPGYYLLRGDVSAGLNLASSWQVLDSRQVPGASQGLGPQGIATDGTAVYVIGQWTPRHLRLPDVSQWQNPSVWECFDASGIESVAGAPSDSWVGYAGGPVVVGSFLYVSPYGSPLGGSTPTPFSGTWWRYPILSTQAGAPLVTALKTRLLSLIASASAVGTVGKAATRALGASATGAATTLKQAGLARLASAGAAATLAAAKVHLVVIAASAATTAGLSRAVALTRAVASLATLAQARAVTKGIALAATSAPSRALALAKALGASGGSSATLATARARLLTLAASAGDSISLARAVGKSLGSTSAATLGLSRSVGKALGATSAAIALALPHRLVFQTVTATASGTVFLSKGILRTLGALAGAVATLATLATHIAISPARTYVVPLQPTSFTAAATQTTLSVASQPTTFEVPAA